MFRTPPVRRALWAALAVLVCFLAFRARPVLAAEGPPPNPGAAKRLVLNTSAAAEAASLSAQPVPPTPAAPQTVAPPNSLDLPAARQAAEDRMAQVVAAGRAPAWETATLAEPVLLYDLSAAPSAYLFPVRDASGAPAGYLTVAAAALPNPVLEYSVTGPDPLADALSRLAGQGYTPVDASRPLYLGLLYYAYEIDPAAAAPGALVPDLAAGTAGRVLFDVRSGALAAALAGQDAPLWAPPLPEAASAEAAASQPDAAQTHNLIAGVPDYDQFQANYEYPGCWSGCAPTATMVVLGYWQAHGYPNLINAGDWQSATSEIRGDMGGQCASAGAGTFTNIGNIPPAVHTFAAARGYTINSDLWGNGWPVAPTYANYRAEIDAGRPILVDLIGHATYQDHSVAGVGYDTSGSYMIIHDNWAPANDLAVQYGTGYREIYMHPVVPAPVPRSGSWKAQYLPALKR